MRRIAAKATTIGCLIALAALIGCAPDEDGGAAPHTPKPHELADVRDGLRVPLARGAAHVTSESLRLLARDGRAGWALRTVGAGGAPELRDPRLIARVDEERVEEIELLGDGALEQRWRFANAPERGSIVVRVEVDDVARVESDARGLVLHSSRYVGARLRYSHGTWIDADGAEHAIESRWDGRAIVLEVPASVVRRSRFPAVLDPRLEPIFGIEPPVEVPWDGSYLHNMRVAGNANGYLVAFTHSNNTYRAHPRIGFMAAGGGFVDPWGTALDTDRLINDTAITAVTAEGPGFLVAWPASGPSGVRAQRVDAFGRPVGAPFWVQREAGLAFYAVGLLPAPGSTLVRSIRSRYSETPRLCTTRIPHGGSPSATRCRNFPARIDLDRQRDPAPWMAASASGWLAAWHDEASDEVRALRFDETSGAYDSLILAPAGDEPLVWRRSSTGYRVLWLEEEVASFVDVPATGPLTVAPARMAGLPARCRTWPWPCRLPVPVRADGAGHFAWGNELGQFEIDGAWTKLADAPYTAPPNRFPPQMAARSGAGYLFAYVSGGLQRFDGARAPVDSGLTLPAREMSRQFYPAIAAGHGRYGLAWADMLTAPGEPTLRVARLDAAGTVLDVTPIESSEPMVPVRVLPVGDRFVILARTTDLDSPFTMHTWSIAALGAPDLRDGQDLAISDPFALLTHAEPSTALLAWDEGGEHHLVRLDADGRVIATSSDSVGGLCRDSAGTLALVGGSGGTWIARVAPTGTPTLTPRWRLGHTYGSARFVTASNDRCVILWEDRSVGWKGALVDGDGLLRGPTQLVVPSGSAFDFTSIVSAGDGTLVLQADHEHLWLFDPSTMTVRTRFPYSPGAPVSDRLAHRIVGASLSPEEHLLVWDMESPARSVGRFPVRLEARFIGPNRGLGEPCLGDFECGAAFCVDGVCCHSACGGGDERDCQACSVSAGASRDGICAPLAAATVCRAAAGRCDAAELCDGASPSCPVDVPAPDGAACEDGLACNGAEQCVAGECAVAAPLECAPPSACMTGSCTEPDGCTWTPIPGCCADDAECDDGDRSTLDECRDAMCRWTPARPDAGSPAVDGGPAPMSDAGTPEDAAAERPDAGHRPGVAGGGCGCRTIPSRPLGGPALVVLALVALSSRRRRARCARGKEG